LSTAKVLSQAGCQVIVIARDFPGTKSINYTSPWAGAHYRPIPDTDAISRWETEFALATYLVFKDIARDESSGVRFLEGIKYFDDPSSAYLELQGRYSHLEGFRVLNKEELRVMSSLGLGTGLMC
jgi:hypothetical protein